MGFALTGCYVALAEPEASVAVPHPTGVLASTNIEQLGGLAAEAAPEAALAKPSDGPSSGTGTASETPPPFTQRIARYETRFAERGDSRSRAHNIRVASAALNGRVIQPGEEFSYNELVGPRTKARGYRVAPVALRGELVDGVGGGACQVSSTVHGAVRRAKLTVVERHEHSRPSTYIARIHEAAVAYGRLDLRFVNNRPYPIQLRVETPRSHLQVSLWQP